MKNAFRIVERQSLKYAYKATSTDEGSSILDAALDLTKPANPHPEWHPLIATPFRYPLPVDPKYQARFRPPNFPKNVFYCSESLETAAFEHGFHFLRERRHLGKNGVRETGDRTAFSVGLDESPVTDLSAHPKIRELTDPKDYAPSHHYILDHPSEDAVKYPSCRDPGRGKNLAVFNIALLGKTPTEQRTFPYRFDPHKKSIVWLDAGLTLKWSDFEG